MTDPGKDPAGVAPGDGGEGEEHSVLEAKYMDFCSARVAEALLSLSPDEMYLLAQEALEEAPTMAGELTYDAIVRLATERISRGLSLPTFDEWAEVYRKDPERYDREMLGLWRTDLEGADEDGS